MQSVICSNSQLLWEIIIIIILDYWANNYGKLESY